MHRRLENILVAWLSLAAAVWITVALFPGLKVDDWHAGSYLAFAAVFAALNLLVGPLLRLLSLPIMLATLGLFGVVINMGLFLLADWFLDTVKIETLWAALGAAVCISIVRAGLTHLVDRRRA